MKVAIIADDLTGASDTGVQMARHGLSASVLLDDRKMAETTSEVVAVDTDSRSVTGREAYRRVAEACESILRLNDFDVIYKKIDSTMRGNIGSELDAVYHQFKPDFIVTAPSFPHAGRVVRGGHMFVNGVPLHESEAARDPKNPVSRSYLPDVLREQTNRPAAVVTLKELRGEGGFVLETMQRYRTEQVPYLLFDAETEADLRRIVSIVRQTGYRVVWAGSAALANALAGLQLRKDAKARTLAIEKGPVCIVMGSVNAHSRKQLEHVLNSPGVIGIEACSEFLLEEPSKRREFERMRNEAEEGMRSVPRAIVVYTSGNAEDVQKARQAGARMGMSAGEVSNEIGRALGEFAAGLIADRGIRNLVLTGGDTAKQVCLNLGAWEMILLGELEVGVPVGRLPGTEDRYVITKAGGFGSEQILNKALEFFEHPIGKLSNF